jgi:ribulose kinase
LNPADERSGTGSARACLVDRQGTLLADHSIPTKTLRSSTDHRIFEQSSSDIWDALAGCSKAVLAASGVSPDLVKGVGFDATCSLAVVDRQGTPLSISRSVEGSGDKEDDMNLGEAGPWNVVLWADHRAEEEAEVINATEEGVLGFVGETMSVSINQTFLVGRLHS